MSREEHVKKIEKAKAELVKAGTIHKRDLMKYIHRLEKELLIYDKYHGGCSLLAGKVYMKTG